MNIFYTNETLYVNLLDHIDLDSLAILKKRIFRIINDYDIDNIIINVIGGDKKNPLLKELVTEYYNRYNGKLVVK